ncbi:sensor histidine kinase [Natrinema zhouii]|uniref:sensor histidine kinase n=1 Tax=Natrinema zhouii TaxID=1710539 RepID=UPI0030F3B384
MFALLALTALAVGLRDPIQNTLTVIGSISRFAAGIHDARAKTRELELEETVEQLKTSNERLEQFAYAASHDLQEPLRMVSTHLQLVERRADDELSDETKEYLEYAVDGADRMREMVQGLLEYSRVEREGKPLESVDLDVIVEDAFEDMQMRIDESQAEVVTDPLPRVRGDANQLRQVFPESGGYAIKYSGTNRHGLPSLPNETERCVRSRSTAMGSGSIPRIKSTFSGVRATAHSR